jgi:hypothetical protein
LFPEQPACPIILLSHGLDFPNGSRELYERIAWIKRLLQIAYTPSTYYKCKLAVKKERLTYEENEK